MHNVTVFVLSNIMFMAGSPNFCQIWLLDFVVNAILHVLHINTGPSVVTCIFDQEIRKMRVLHVYTSLSNLSVLRSTNIAEIQK